MPVQKPDCPFASLFNHELDRVALAPNLCKLSRALGSELPTPKGMGVSKKPRTSNPHSRLACSQSVMLKGWFRSAAVGYRTYALHSLLDMYCSPVFRTIEAVIPVQC